SDGIELLDQHLLGHVALVLGGGVEVARAGSRLELDLFADTFGHVLLLVGSVGGRLRQLRRGRASRPGLRRCRSCRWYGWPGPRRAGEPSGFRSQPRTGAIAGWAGNDAWSC